MNGFIEVMDLFFIKIFRNKVSLFSCEAHLRARDALYLSPFLILDNYLFYHLRLAMP
jgi:hypothetical protein